MRVWFRAASVTMVGQRDIGPDLMPHCCREARSRLHAQPAVTQWAGQRDPFPLPRV
jgi:hypothetical protein